MYQDLLDKIKSLSGYALFSVMKQSRGKNPNIFLACYQRAKELIMPVGSWTEAKKEFDSLLFPTNIQAGFNDKTLKIRGYTCQISQTVSETMKVRNQIMSLVNHRTNQCVIRWGVRGGEVDFN
jgi:hypothetical protein